jgi:hypothetical protein
LQGIGRKWEVFLSVISLLWLSVKIS